MSIKNRDDGKTVQEYQLEYNKRFFNVSSKTLKNYDNLEICLLAKNSQGAIKNYFKNQCFNLSSNWKDINKKCKINIKRFCDVYDSKTKLFSGIATTSASSLQRNSYKKRTMALIGFFTVFSRIQTLIFLY